jgi:hypothetical protein
LQKQLLFLWFTCLLINSQFICGQIINNLSGDAFTDKPFFDRDFIKRNRIKSFEGQFSRKKDGDIVRTSKDFFKYSFDSTGNLISTFQVRSDFGKKDTSVNYYVYDQKNRLTIHRKTESGGLTAFHYQYDSLDRLISIEQKRDIVDENGLVVNSISINKETMKYFKLESGFKKVTYNNYGLPYMDEFESWNSDGYKIEEIQKLRMGSTEYKKKFFYNEKGLLSSWNIHYNNSEKPVKEAHFKYDSFGNLIERKNYIEGIFTGELQIIYDNKTQLLGSTIEKLAGSNFLLILRFMDVQFFK